MIESVPLLTQLERDTLKRLISHTLRAGEPPILRVILFGSKARGDFDHYSDLDLLMICDLPPDDRELAAKILSRDARVIGAEAGVQVETWTITTADLDEGSRTPMLVDALEDGVTLWPKGAPRLELPFTPADARFCADCLLDWVETGGPFIEEALNEGRWDEAAMRARDDITRLATAALLLRGETRHRRTSSIKAFIERFIESGDLSPELLPALEWAIAAYPPNGYRGSGRPPPSRSSTESADQGYDFVRMMAMKTIPILDYLVRLGSSEVSASGDGGPPASIRKIPIR